MKDAAARMLPVGEDSLSALCLPEETEMDYFKPIQLTALQGTEVSSALLQPLRPTSAFGTLLARS